MVKSSFNKPLNYEVCIEIFHFWHWAASDILTPWQVLIILFQILIMKSIFHFFLPNFFNFSQCWIINSMTQMAKWSFQFLVKGCEDIIAFFFSILAIDIALVMWSFSKEKKVLSAYLYYFLFLQLEVICTPNSNNHSQTKAIFHIASSASEICLKCKQICLPCYFTVW